MKKRKLTITLITANEKEEYNLLGEYDLEKEIICYQESKSLLTEVILNLKQKTLTRENRDYYLKYELLEGKVTENEIRIKDLNQSMILKIKTEKFEIKDNKVEIIYNLLDSEETIHYQIKF